MKIRCIKGFLCNGGTQAIMKGEEFSQSKDEFFQSDTDSEVFVSSTYNSRFPGMWFEFDEKRLSKHFEIIFEQSTS